MKFLIVGLLGICILTGCGATYTRLERDSSAGPSPAAPHADCPDGIDYMTGRCR